MDAQRDGSVGVDEAAVRAAVEALRVAILRQDRATLDALTTAQLSYSHSTALVQDKTEFIAGVMNRGESIKWIEFPELTVAIVGTTAIARHLWLSQSEAAGKMTNVRIGVLLVWQKRGDDWRLLARAAWRLPEPAKPA